MKRIVISGASGFLGQSIIAEAEKNGVPVLAISTHPEKILSASVECVGTAGFLNGSVKLLKTDVFINCLFPTNADGIKMANGLQTVYATIKVAKESGVGAFINISSQSVYASKREVAADEKMQLSLETPYAVGKYSTEVLTNVLFEGASHTNIRLASLLGVGYDQRIVNRMIVQALKGDTLKVVGGMQRYGFLDVRDAAVGLLTLSQSEATTWKEEYNLGRLESYTLIEVAEAVIRELHNKGLLASYEVGEGVDTRNSSLIPNLFMQEFNWRPRITFEQTVRDIIESKL